MSETLDRDISCHMDITGSQIKEGICYFSFSTETKQEPVNAASFGKLIRSVFLGLRTRRIGTRGNSKVILVF